DELRAAPAGERRALLEERMRTQAARVLGVAPGRLDSRIALQRLGLTSMMTFELRNWLKMALGVTVDMDDLAPTQSVAQLTARVLALFEEAADEDAGEEAPVPAEPAPRTAPVPEAEPAPAAAVASAVLSAGGDEDAAWIVRPRPLPDPAARLLCIPFAGAGPSAFRGWAEALPEGVELGVVQLPGRDGRRGEEPLTRVTPVVDALASAMEPLLDRPYAVFGHSLGGLLGFELVRELRRRGAPLPAHLFVSASRAPHLPDQRPPIHRLPEDRLITELRKMNGTPEEILRELELLRLFLPLVRADFAILETYLHRNEAPLELPVTAFGGHDDRRVERPELEGWAEQTSAGFELEMFPGDHFYFRGARDALIARMTAVLPLGEPLAHGA
ncbi:MAG TPA: thioesterase domain-containing protein, partial [Longimicrobiaceae bacterium]|nr:thioesterase domain-containing protein [Longimicrobiaceae bacterium]